jgi:hypothetical protein
LVRIGLHGPLSGPKRALAEMCLRYLRHEGDVRGAEAVAGQPRGVRAHGVGARVRQEPGQGRVVRGDIGLVWYVIE